MKAAVYCIAVLGFLLFSSLFCEGSMVLGSMIPNGNTDSSCPTGFTCTGYTIACPAVNTASVFTAVAPSIGTPRGVLMLLSNSGGTKWWNVESTESMNLIDTMQQNGFTVVMLRWSKGWFRTSTGNTAGVAVTACRPATAVQFVRNTYYVPLGLPPAESGKCGFCLSGNALGASQAAYSLAHYGMDPLIDGLILTGGPDYSALAKSCLKNVNEGAYWFSSSSRSTVDTSYGYLTSGTGPCALRNPAFTNQWQSDSLLGGTDFYHPTTNVAFLLGSIDASGLAIGRDYYQRLVDDTSPMVSWQLILSASGQILNLPAGRDAWKNAILNGYVPPDAPPPPPPLSGDPLPLGVVIPLNTLATNCPPGLTCPTFKVRCPGISKDHTFYLSYMPPTGTPRGVIAAFSGGGGQDWWTQQNPEIVPMVQDLREMGFGIVMIRWLRAWANGITGVDLGPAKIACRPATVVRYIYDTYYVPMGNPVPRGTCGFCVTGNSGGSTQTGYTVTHYGLDSILDAILPTGGPTYSALTKSCMWNPGEENYHFSDPNRAGVDSTFGFTGSAIGPCALHDPAFIPRWTENAIATGGNRYVYPNTRVHIIVGDGDHDFQYIAGDFFNRLVSEGNIQATFDIAPQTGHRVLSTQQGRDAWLYRLLATFP